MSAKLSNFRAYFPEYGSTEDGAVTTWLEYSSAYLNAGRLGGQHVYASCLLTAHKLTLSAMRAAALASGNLDGQAAALAGKSIGDVSWSYDNSSKAQSDSTSDPLNLTATAYGKELASIIKSTVAPVGVISG